MKYLLPVLFLLASFNNFGQTPIKFRKVIGNDGYENGYSAKQTLDSGYIVGGSTTSFGNGNNDMYLLKTDKFGVPTVQNTFGGINVDVGKCVRQTTDKGYILVGYTNSYGAGGYDVYIVKTDSMLQTQWTKTYGGSDWDFGNCIEQTTDKGYIICGSTYSYGKGNSDYYLIKTDSLGDTIWTKTFGDSLEDVANSVIQTTDGGYAITGTTKSMGDTLGDFYTIKTNAIGDTIWTNKFGGASLDYGNDILESVSGSYIVCGETQSYGSGNSDAIIIKLTTNGSFMYLWTYGSVGPLATNYDVANSITEDAEGKIAMVGATQSFGFGGGHPDAYFSILKSDWSYYSASTFGGTGDDYGYSVEPTSDNCFIICGYTNGFYQRLNDIYLIKTDTLGYAGITGSETFFTTNIQDNASLQNNVSIFPNPANDNLIVNLNQNKIHTQFNLSITDILGQEIKRMTIESTSILNIKTNELKDGMYFLTISDKVFVSTNKIIVHH
ncbi:MAG: T9SS type A sorting domain-containing protein [Bacteroidota bacterium]